MTITVAGLGDIRQRLGADGIAALGLAGPLFCPAWTDTTPAVNEAALTFTVAGTWHAPLPGVLMKVADGTKLGLSRLDGTPAVAGNAACVVLVIHPQLRLRIEREMVAVLQAGGQADQSLRPVPATIVMQGGTYTLDNPLVLAPGDKFMFAGQVSFHDEHGLIVDPFAFAAAIASVLAQNATLGVALPTGATGTVQAIATSVTTGQFAHLVDLHGRPWSDPPGTNPGVSLYTGTPGARVEATHLGDGALHPWPNGAVLSGGADVEGAQTPPPATLLRFGWSTLGRMGTAPLSWPPAGAQTPARDTLRVAVVDPVFHLLGNRTAVARDGVGAADALTVAEAPPAVRDGSPVTLLADGRSCLGFFEQVILGLQGGNPSAPFSTGPLLGASVMFDDGAWPLPVTPGALGRWPVAPAATPVPGNDATVLGQLAPLRTGTTANWIAGSNDVLVTLPPGLPVGVAVRLYPIVVLLGTTPDEQPLLQRGDGGATVVSGGPDTVVLTDPFRLGPTPVRAGSALLRADAAVAWQPVAGGPPIVKLIANMAWPVGADVARPAAGPANLLALGFWRGVAAAPMLGSPAAGAFTLATVFADPVAFVQSVVRQMTTDQNPRQAPRLPTMSRTESLLSVQLQPAAGGADLYRSVLTGGWLTREADTHSYRLANPAAAGAHEVHAPGVGASSQLGYDLWVAALHRARPVVPTADVAGVFESGPIAGLPSNWVLLQANATSVPPAPPATPSTVAGAVLQTVPAFVETPELALVPDDDIAAVNNFITTTLPGYLTMPNQPDIGRQVMREVRSAKYGRRDAQWALRRALRHARALVYVETPLLGATAHGAGAPSDAAAAVDIVTELAARLGEEPRLRVVLLVPRTPPYVHGYEPWSMYFYGVRTALAQTLTSAAGTVPAPGGTRPRVVVAHPMGVPGRPLVIRTTTVIVDDVWCMTGTSSLSRRGLTFDGANDVVLSDWGLDRGAGASIRAHRKALMGAHLGVGPGVAGTGGGAPASAVGAPEPDWVRLHQPVSAHEVFADVLASGGRGKLLPLWAGPDPLAPGAPFAHPPEVADPDGRGGASLVTTIAAAIGGSTTV